MKNTKQSPFGRCAAPDCSIIVDKEGYCNGCKTHVCSEHDTCDADTIVCRHHEPSEHWSETYLRTLLVKDKVYV